MTIRYAHAGDLDTTTVHRLDWKVGITGSRYQEIAIVDDKVIGSWTYEPELKRGRWFLDSGHTEVTARYRRKGVARALWFAGIARWKPTSIEARIGTDEGRDFLARMIGELALRAPDTRLWVKTRNEDETTWESNCAWAAQQLLRKLGEKHVAQAKPLKLLKAGAA